jgi:16S rRNA A1518/A1519 N6-dimethyltransferase RsmA/KsgA/DIM1 with predicted DNA glycosylase/AP lyase activity
MIAASKGLHEIEYGDYQTPNFFANSVCSTLRHIYGFEPTVVIEPTFGTGNFIDSVISEFNTVNAIYGIEVNEAYFAKEFNNHSSLACRMPELHLFNADIFAFDFNEIKSKISKEDLVLVIGNPPWATNSQLSSINSYNLPIKENFKGYSGLDAITGKGNFDIAEYIVLQMLNEFSHYNCVVAMLCKTIVAKNIIRDMQKYKFKIAVADMFVFNAKDVFNVSCDAALFVVRLGNVSTSICNVYDYYTRQKTRQFGWENGLFFANISEKKI